MRRREQADRDVEPSRATREIRRDEDPDHVVDTGRETVERLDRHEQLRPVQRQPEEHAAHHEHDDPHGEDRLTSERSRVPSGHYRNADQREL